MGEKKKVLFLLILIWSILIFVSCNEESSVDTEEAQKHKSISVVSSYKDMSEFIDLVHEKYPEINIKVIPYSGDNYTAYVRSQLISDDMPDIYITKFYAPGQKEFSDRLLDLSGYDFTSQYSQARLRDVTDKGAIYMLPIYYDCLGITYNKTLLEKNGWKLPKSFKELEELAPKVKAAGYQLALNQIQYPGYGFQYLCNILDTDFLNTIDGRIWQNDFLTDKTTIADTPKMKESFKVLEKWKNIGMLNKDGSFTDDEETRKIMGEGKTLFMLGSANHFREGETEDEFGLMPYLSEDGTQNAYILNVSRYLGLNKHLADDGNEQKLEDALHIMEVLSTAEGMKAFNRYYSQSSLLPLKDYKIQKDSIYSDIQEELNAGFTAPFIYCGWENVIVPVGEQMISYIKGETTVDELITTLDKNQSLIWNNSDSVYTTATEKIDNKNCAKLVGICLAKASKADVALISINKWYKLGEEDSFNVEGVNGELYPVPITDEVITSIFPTSWRGTIETVTLCGKRIKELEKDGYDYNKNGKTFPYVLVTPENFEIEDESTYTVAICGVSDEVAKEGNLKDTKILGLDAAREYFSQFEKFSIKDIVWEKPNAKNRGQ